MTNNIFLIIIFVLFLSYPSLVRSDDSVEVFIKNSTRMKSESLIKYSPDIICEQISQDYEKGGFASAQEDICFQIYASNIFETVNKQYPKAKLIRKELNESYKYLDIFLQKIFLPGSWHSTERLPARIEWMMLNGVRNKFMSSNPGNEINDIKNIATTIYNSCYEITGPEYKDKTEVIFSMLEKAIQYFEKSEINMDEKEKKYFRKETVKYLSQYLENNI